MSVIPDCITLFRDCADLHQFLLACKQTLTPQNPTKLIGISLEIPPVDPLVVLSEIASPHQRHFYLEKRWQGEAIAAFEPILQLQAEGERRFLQIQAFIEDCLANAIAVGTVESPVAGSRFFCSFTFFDRNLNRNSPFPAATVFLPRWQIARHGDHCTVVVNTTIKIGDRLEILAQTLWRDLQKICDLRYKNFGPGIHRQEQFKIDDVTDTNNFKAAVLDALSLIQQQQLSKIVLAHAIEAIAPLPFQVVASLNNLRQIHPDCYVFSVSNGQGQTFMGASPERLIGIRDRELIADALAGSAPRGQSASEDAQLAQSLLNSPKEQHEHQVVIDFVIQHLSRLGLLPRFPAQPGLRQLSNIQHLWTPIQTTLAANAQPLEILAALHPTPAVAGVPRDRACQQILDYETFERSLYAAPLGWIDHHGNSEFIVGIRSALIEGCRARLYAGAGIVAGSDPDRELSEVRLKLQALLAALV